MNTELGQKTLTATPIHPWLRRDVHVACVEGATTPLGDEATAGIMRGFACQGHIVQDEPDEQTDVILTAARFGEPIEWRNALLFTARQRFKLRHTPTIYTVVPIHTEDFGDLITHFSHALEKDTPDPDDFDFAGLAPQAHRVLYEQGRRGGPILALERLVQSQTKSLQVLLVVGDTRPHVVYHFDLVGAYPRSDADQLDALYDDVVLRIVTKLSTREITDHKVDGAPLPRAAWDELDTPAAMYRAGREFGQRNFFTNMVRISDVVHVPAVGDAVAEQYSEGCFATWDPTLHALVATVTGSARPVEKGSINEEDLAIITGIRAERTGALVRHVEGKRNDPPSSEAVEMMMLEQVVPTISVGEEWEVPAARSILHGHRGVGAYDPQYVEYVPLEPAYHQYLVSCATAAQARGVRDAFARSEALQTPDDPRTVAFTILPGHGVVLVEKWVPDTMPFQTLWEYMDAGYIEIESHVPQGSMRYVPGSDGKVVLQRE